MTTVDIVSKVEREIDFHDWEQESVFWHFYPESVACEIANQVSVRLFNGINSNIVISIKAEVNKLLWNL